ncbi:hypothetical protein JW859_01265 [bacterium]|nr:hypothetical protein [bacterium]
MQKLAGMGLFAVAVGYALAHFLVAFYNHWYFADSFWLKVALLTPLIALSYLLALFSSWRPVWLILGIWWLITHLLAMVPAGGYDLRGLAFVAVLDFEVAVVWVPCFALTGWGVWRAIRRARAGRSGHRAVVQELQLRRKLRHYEGRNET